MRILEWINGIWSIGMAYITGLFAVRIFEIEYNQYQSGHLDNSWSWFSLKYRHIRGVVDLDANMDSEKVRKYLYWYEPWFIEDGDLPDLTALWFVAEEAYKKINVFKVLSHCGGGVNRASLMNGCILYLRGYRGDAIVERIRSKRPGALTNSIFEKYLRGLVNDVAKYVRVK